MVAIDTTLNLPTTSDLGDPDVWGQQVLAAIGKLKTAIEAINSGKPDSGASGGAAAPDASTTSKGIVQLAGDLGGTADAPRVLGKAASSHTHAISSITNLQTQLNQKAPSSRGLPAGGAAGSVLLKTAAGDFLVGWGELEVPNVAVNGVYPTRPPARLVCWVGPDPGSAAAEADSWRIA